PINGIGYHKPGIELGTCVMDLSDELGWVIGETVPQGYVYVQPKQMVGNELIRGYFLNPPVALTSLEYEVFISAVWIAKKRSGIFEYTKGKCGVIACESRGRISV